MTTYHRQINSLLFFNFLSSVKATASGALGREQRYRVSSQPLHHQCIPTSFHNLFKRLLNVFNVIIFEELGKLAFILLLELAAEFLPIHSRDPFLNCTIPLRNLVHQLAFPLSAILVVVMEEWSTFFVIGALPSDLKILALTKLFESKAKSELVPVCVLIG